MKPSTRKLLEMLPATFVVCARLGLDEAEPRRNKVELLSVLDGQGKPTTLDPNYPGFVTNLERLIAAGRVLHVADAPRGPKGKRHVESLFISIKPTLKGSATP